MTAKDFLRQVKRVRLDNCGWYYWSGNVDGREVKLKGYGTWIQRLVVYDGGVGTISTGPSECSVKELNSFLLDAVSR